MSKSRPPPIPQQPIAVPGISSSPTPPPTVYKQRYPVAIASSASVVSNSTPSSSPVPSPTPPAVASASATTPAVPSSSPFQSRPSSFSASPGTSLINHSSVERPTPPYLSQRNSFVFDGESMDGSYSYVISAPASNAPSPTLTPHHSQINNTGQLPSIGDLSIHPTQSSSAPPPTASSSSPTRFVPPPVPAHMRSSPGLTPSSSSARPESPSPNPVPAPSAAVRRGSSSSTSSSLASSSSNSSSSTPSSQSQQDDAKTVEFYLKQAINAKDAAAINSLLDKATTLHVDSNLIYTAQTVLVEKRNESISSSLYYLRQGIETRNKEQLKMSIEKLTPLLAEGGVSAEVGALVDRGRKVLEATDKESAQTVQFYLRQGIQLRNRDVIKQSLDKAHSVPAELLDKELVTAAQALLTELDAQHLIKFYLQTAIKQKDDMALETALEQAKKLRMGGDVAEVSEGSKLLVELRTKGRGKSSKKGKGGVLSNGDKKGSKAAKFQLFGGPLIEAVRRSDRPIPRLCSQCMDFLRANGLDEPGLFRVAGNKDAIEAIRHEYEEGDGAEVRLEEVHDVAGVFKLYLRMLPEPLIPYSRYDAFIRVGALKDKARELQRNTELREQVAQLPTENYALLCSLVRFLVEVSNHSGLNKMTPENLAIVFAPNLLRPAEETPNTMLYDMPIAIAIIASFLLHADEIFTHEPQTACAQPSAPAPAASAAAGGGVVGAASTGSAGGGGHMSHSSVSLSMSSTLPGPISSGVTRKAAVQNNTL